MDSIDRGNAFVAGAFIPVFAVIMIGLSNEGFRSIRFLFYPGIETWVQTFLLVAFSIVVAAILRSDVKRSRRNVETYPTLVAAWWFSGFILSAVVLVVLGVGETPWRKFYTFVVAPRAVSVWLTAALFVYLMRLRPSSRPAV